MSAFLVKGQNLLFSYLKAEHVTYQGKKSVWKSTGVK